MTTSAVTVPIQTHYFHFDQQGVIFNMWYLGFMEEARNGFLAGRGYPLGMLLDEGFDIQVVHSEIDWISAVRFGDDLSIVAQPVRVGTTSFALGFSIRVADDVRATATSVYVIVDGQTFQKTALPGGLRAALAD